MRTELDFAPLYRSSIGFDRVFNLLNNAQRLQAVDLWPPYDIVKLGDDEYAITMAVAGFSQSDLDVTQERNVLIIKGAKAEKKEGETYIGALADSRSSVASNWLTMFTSRRRRSPTVSCELS